MLKQRKFTRFFFAYQLLRQVERFVYIDRLGILIALAIGGVLLHFVSDGGVSREHIHLMLFPIFVLGVWIVPRDRSTRMPIVLVVLATVAWLCNTLIFYGNVGFFPVPSTLVFSALSDDYGEISTRAAVRRYDQIAQTYDAPSTYLLHFGFSTRHHASKWLESQDAVKLVICGNKQWYTLVTTALRLPETSLSRAENDGVLLTIEDEFGVIDPESVVRVRIPGLSLPFYISTRAEEIQIPAEPSELVLHVLAWLSRGVDSESSWANSLDAFREASRIVGPWRSHSALALSEFFLGTQMLVWELAQPIGKGNIQCIYKAFNRGAGYVDAEHSPYLRAAIFNNAAIARLVGSFEPEALAKAESLFEHASTLTDANGHPVQAAKAAMLNLRVLDCAFASAL